MLLDSILYASSRMTSVSLSGILKTYRLWVEKGKQNAVDFLYYTLIPTIKNNTGKVVEFFVQKFFKKLAIGMANNIASSWLGNKFFGKYYLYKWYSVLGSTGSIISNVLDILDGYWDGYISIKVRG